MFWTQSERVECCTCLHHCLSVWFDPRTWHVFKKPFLFQPFSIGFNSCRQMGIECEFKLDNVHTTVRNSDSRVWGLRIWTIPSKMACWIFWQEWLTGTSYFKSLSLSLNLSFFSLVCQLCWTAGNHYEFTSCQQQIYSVCASHLIISQLLIVCSIKQSLWLHNMVLI